MCNFPCTDVHAYQLYTAQWHFTTNSFDSYLNPNLHSFRKLSIDEHLIQNDCSNENYFRLELGMGKLLQKFN